MADGKPIAYMLQVQWLYEYWFFRPLFQIPRKESDWPNIADAPGALAAWCILDFTCHCGQLLSPHGFPLPSQARFSIPASRIFPKSLILQSAWISLHIGTGSLCQVDMGELSPPRKNFQLEDRSQPSLLSFRRMILRHILYAFSDGSQ